MSVDKPQEVKSPSPIEEARSLSAEVRSMSFDVSNYAGSRVTELVGPKPSGEGCEKAQDPENVIAQIISNIRVTMGNLNEIKHQIDRL